MSHRLELAPLLGPSLLCCRRVGIQVALAWFLSNRAESLVGAVLAFPGIRQVVVVLAECARANATCAMVVLAMNTLKVGVIGRRAPPFRA